MKNIVLIGIMGCGKTTVAEILGSQLNRPFMDLDAQIEKVYGPIPQLFEQGENCFREAESRIIEEISSLSGYVISTGGGVVLIENNIMALKRNGIIFFIDRPIEKIIESVDCSTRPLLKNGPEALYAIYKKRYSLYVSYCDYHIKSTNDLSDTVGSIQKILMNQGLMNQ